MREKDKISHKYVFSHGLDTVCERRMWLEKVSLCGLRQRGNLCCSGWEGCLIDCRVKGRTAGTRPQGQRGAVRPSALPVCASAEGQPGPFPHEDQRFSSPSREASAQVSARQPQGRILIGHTWPLAVVGEGTASPVTRWGGVQQR